MPVDYTLLGKKISYYREKVSLSQEALADLVHVNKYHINRIEKGHSCPSPDLLVDIANALRTTVDDLVADSLLYQSQSNRLAELTKDCTPTEETIITRNAEHLKQILNDLHI